MFIIFSAVLKTWCVPSFNEYLYLFNKIEFYLEITIKKCIKLYNHASGTCPIINTKPYYIMQYNYKNVCKYILWGYRVAHFSSKKCTNYVKKQLSNKWILLFLSENDI